MKKNTIILSFIFILLTICGFSIYQKFFFEARFSENQAVSYIQDNIQNQIQVIDNEQAEIKNNIIEKANLNHYFEELKPSHSTYIFENGKIVFWSDFKLFPKFIKLKNSKSVFVSGDNNGKKITQIQSFKFKNSTYIIVSILKLSEHIIEDKNNIVKLNNNLFDNYILTISHTKNSKYIVKDKDGNGLFGIINLKSKPKSNLILLLCYVIVSVLGITMVILKFNIKNELNTQFLTSIFTLIIVTIGYYFFVFLFENNKILNLYFYGILLIICIVVLSKTWLKFNSGFNIKINNKYLEILAFYIFFVFVTYLYFKSIAIIYNQQSCDFSINNLFKFNEITYYGFFISICISVCYFFISHFLLYHLTLKHIKNSIEINILYVFGLTIIISLLFTIGTGVGWIYVSFLASIYFNTIYFSRLSITIKKIKYITYFYFFIFILFSALTISCAIYKVEFAKRATMSKFLATKVSRTQPNLDALFISTGLDSCSGDSLAKQILVDSIQNREDLESELIKKNFPYVSERYETKFYFFNSNGNSISEQLSKNFFSIQKKINKPKLNTKFKNVYRLDSDQQGYFAWRPIKDSSAQIVGYLLMEFRLRKLIPNSIYPELFTKIKYQSDYNYSYALYIKNNLTSVYNQKSSFVPFQTIGYELIEDFKKGKIINDRFMRITQTNDNEYVMIGVDAFTWILFYSNFSFFFIFFTFILALIILINTLYFKLKQVSNTLSTKIQLFIHLSFFIPLLSVSISIFFIINHLYQNDISDNYQQKTLSSKEQLYSVFEKNNMNEIQQKLNEVSAFAKVDLNLYNPTGELLATTQPSVFENGFLGNIINPKAFKNIKSNSELSYVLDEYFGDFHFKTVYQAINSYKTGETLAILAVPFFESNDNSNEKITFVLTSILNIFSLIFILFMTITFFVSRYLTVPLTMLTQSLKNVSLEQQNMPLAYTGEDEIGLLVKEYNNMLVKLKESKKTLALSEKESAWKEMAKQVAHEIKNPLTPIKLTLQNIQRLLKQDRTDKIEIIQKSAESILDQVETLADIANSFAAFTQMPNLKQEVFKLDEMIENITQLYKLNHEVHIKFDKQHNTDFEIVSDKKLLNRVVLNLIINAIESMDYSKINNIEISLSTKDETTYLIVIKDNGTGILPENYEKVFQPNFSTKNTGSGIGLAISKRGIDQMGGKIKFESVVGRGTIFILELPKKPV